MELIRWFSSFFFFFFPFGKRWGEGRGGLRGTQEGLACSTRLRGKRLWGESHWGRDTEGKRALAMGHGALLIPYERSGRSRYCHANNRISFVATLIPACSFKLSLCSQITPHLPLQQCSETINKLFFNYSNNHLLYIICWLDLLCASTNDFF